jgi:hypothetical protein
MESTESRSRRWPRLVLTLPPDKSDALDELARVNYRDRKREALRLLMDGIEREAPEHPDGPADSSTTRE